MWDRTVAFVRNAWAVILTVGVVLWFLLTIPATGESAPFAAVPVEDSVFATVSVAIAPIFAPLGFGS